MPIYYCSDFMRKACPQTQKWPYVCPANCKKRSDCNYQKASYSAYDADLNYRNRLSSTRSGITVTQEELIAMDKLITPLIKQGQSYEAIWSEHEQELPIGLRSAYNYPEKGLFTTSNIDLPRKVRYKLWKKPVSKRAQCERSHEQLRRILPKGRSDFDALSTWDCAAVASHINSYPSPKQAGARPIDLIQGLVPQELLDLLGIERIAPDDVTLKPKLVNHAVIL